MVRDGSNRNINRNRELGGKILYGTIQLYERYSGRHERNYPFIIHINRTINNWRNVVGKVGKHIH